MGTLKIFRRGGEDVQRFEENIYDLKEIAMELCETFEQMKSQFGDEEESYGERSSYRMGSRMGERGGSMGERRGRDSMGRYR